MTAHHIVVMGVSGSGKSTVGQLLADRLGASFIDSDSLHPDANVAKMRAGLPLDDHDREPWLKLVGETLASAGQASLVVACSALKRVYRDLIRTEDSNAEFLHLEGDAVLLAQRLADRAGHFMPAKLLGSQLETLEPLDADERGFALDIAETPEVLAEKAAARFIAAPGGA